MNHERLLALVHAQMNGEINPEQHAELEQHLRDDWQARRLYLEFADQDARLLRQPEIASGRLHDAVATRPRTAWGRRSLPWAVAAAAAVAVAALGWHRAGTRHEGREAEATFSGVAMLSQELDACFATRPLLRGDAIVPGPIRLERGLAQIDFFSGATVLIEGEAALEIMSAWEVRCLSGRVRVRVPPAAKGFLVHAPGVKLEDLGTEFALNVEGNGSAVRVYDGEVIVHTDAQPASLTSGMTLGRATRDFLPSGELQSLAEEREASRFAAWRRWFERTARDPRLVACYGFERSADDRWDRLVRNDALPERNARDGGAVGARRTSGRWAEKGALEFKRPGDRVRLNIDGTYAAATFACWVRVDSVDNRFSGLLLTDGYDDGEPHWQIHENGSLMFSIMYRPPGRKDDRNWNQIYYSRPVFGPDSLGRWHHIAVSYSGTTGEVTQYFDGVRVSHEVSALHRPDRLLTFGPCEIGNWGLPTANHSSPVRNLNGVIDEFLIYDAALTDDEVRDIYTNGKPE
jgi:hypothetical protein